MNAFRSDVAVMVGAFLGVLLTAHSSAAPPTDETGCALRIATGPAGKVYERAFSDMRAVCGAEVPLCQVPSEGGLQNLSLLAANQADLALVQLDTLETMMRSGDEGIASLQALLPLHANLLHIVALASGTLVDVTYVMGVAVPHTGHTVVIRKFSELRGLRVAAVGSAQLVARMLDRQTGFGLAIEDVNTDDQAVAKLRSGAVQAIFTLGGWPTPLIARLRSDAGLMLAEFDMNPQPPYRIAKRSYQNLAQYNVSFLSVPNLLVTRPFKPTGAYGRRVADLQRCLVQHLDELQEGNYSPMWKEIKDASDTLGVPPFSASSARKTAGR
jgi:TRAP-type uncharacterized transport system substrate-binding protein